MAATQKINPNCGKLVLCRDFLTKYNYKSSRKIYPNMPFIFILVIISPNLLELGGILRKKPRTIKASKLKKRTKKAGKRQRSSKGTELMRGKISPDSKD